MTPRNSGQKIILFKKATLFGLCLSLLFSVLTPLLLYQTASARAEEYAYNYTIKDNKVSDVKAYAKNATFFSNAPQTFQSDAKITDSAPDAYKDKIKNGFTYTATYNCSAGGKREAGSSSTITTEFWFVRLNIYMGYDGTDSSSGIDKQASIKGIPYLSNITHYQKSTSGETRPAPDEKKDDEGLNGDQIRDSKIPSECLPDYDTRGGDVNPIKTIKNLKKMTDSDQASWGESAKNNEGGADTNSGNTKAEEDACNATGSPMSWIICPIIDMGSKFTDFVFNDIVRPFLEDVPISSNPDDPSYNAWKQFRLIGNIVLIGSLMAVVYAQARGDK